MSGKTVIGLLAVFGVLCLLFWLTTRMEEQAERQVIESKRLFTFEADAITTLTIVRLGESPVSAVRTPEGNWSIAEPDPEIPANAVVWDRVAKAVAYLSNERTVSDSPEALSEYELEEPFLRVTVGTHEELTEIAFGAHDPTRLYRYARVGGGPIVLVPVDTAPELDRSLMDLRDRRLVHVGEEGITRIEFARLRPPAESGEQDADAPLADEASVAAVFERQPDGPWRMIEPVDSLADQESVQALATELQFAVGRGYVDRVESLADYGLAHPAARIAVYSGAERESEVLYLGWVAGGEDGGLYVKLKDSHSVFVIDGHILTLIPESPLAFRDRRLFTRETKDLVGIRYRDETGAFRLELDEQTGWRIVQPAPVETNQRVVSQYIGQLAFLSGRDFPAGAGLAEFGLDEPGIEIDFEFMTAPAASIQIGTGVPGTQDGETGEDGFYYALRTDGVVTTVSQQTVDGLHRESFDFQIKRIFSTSSRAVTQVSLTFEGKAYKMRKVEQRWALTEPAEMKFESQSDAAGLLEALTEAAVSGIAQPPPAPGETGLDAPVLEATLTVASKEAGTPDRVLGLLRVGGVVPGEAHSRFAMYEGRREIFFVTQGLIDDLREALRGVVFK